MKSSKFTIGEREDNLKQLGLSIICIIIGNFFIIYSFRPTYFGLLIQENNTSTIVIFVITLIFSLLIVIMGIIGIASLVHKYIRIGRRRMLEKDGSRYCDRCGTLLTKENNKCGYEICDRCNEYLDAEYPAFTKDNETYNNNKDYAACDQFVCAKCGIELQGWTKVVRDEEAEDITHQEYEFKFCPNCGRKIIETDKYYNSQFCVIGNSAGGKYYSGNTDKGDK